MSNIGDLLPQAFVGFKYEVSCICDRVGLNVVPLRSVHLLFPRVTPLHPSPRIIHARFAAFRFVNPFVISFPNGSFAQFAR